MTFIVENIQLFSLSAIHASDASRSAACTLEKIQWFQRCKQCNPYGGRRRLHAPSARRSVGAKRYLTSTF
jgi:hypothetical protein